MDNNRFVWQVRPRALADNTIVGDAYRITVLTPALLRVEYSASGTFEDRASQSMFFRDFDKTAFTASTADGVLTVEEILKNRT